MDRMTAEDFNAREAELLAKLPVELRSVVSMMAYDRGHAYGYDEVLGHVMGYVAELAEPMQKFGQRCAAQGNMTLENDL